MSHIITHPSGHIPPLTGARGFAAIWVVLFHLWQAQEQPHIGLAFLDLTPFFACGYFGVDLFFVLSGYLLAIPYIQARMNGHAQPSLRIFWCNRLKRVLPAYLTQLAILFGVAAFLGKEITLQEIATHLTLSFNLFDNTSSFNPVYWSMPVEWDFYVILPLLALGFARRSGLPWILPLAIVLSLTSRALCVAALSAWGMDGLPYYRWIIQLPARLDQFVFGMAAAWLVLAGRGRPIAKLAGPIGFAIAAFLAINVAPLGDIFAHAKTPWIYFQATLLGLAAACLILATALNPSGVAARALSSRSAVFLGTVSYSLYLWHYPILDWLQTLNWLPLYGVAFSFTAVVICVFVATISYVVVESPFLRRYGNHRHATNPK